jgi:6-phosphogluconolactonase
VVTKVVPGLLIATPDAEQAAGEACSRMRRAINEAIKERGAATIALSGGSSPIEAYRCLAKEAIDWNKVHIYWVDERAVPPDSDRSNFGSAKKALLDAIAIPPENVHRMRGEDPDLEKAAADYEAVLRNIKAKVAGLPSLDLVVLGIGDDGHTASLFPGEDTVNITDRLVAVVPAREARLPGKQPGASSSLRERSGAGAGYGAEPHGEAREARLTLTSPVLENAKASVIIVLGKSKHDALERIWATSGDVKTTPARIIRGFRGAVTWVIDRAAGGMG